MSSNKDFTIYILSATIVTLCTLMYIDSRSKNKSANVYITVPTECAKLLVKGSRVGAKQKCSGVVKAEWK